MTFANTFPDSPLAFDEYISDTLLPEQRPIFINPRIRISLKEGLTKDCGIEKAEDLFNWENCLGCLKLLDDNYGSHRENPCLECDCLVKRLIVEINKKTRQRRKL